MTSTFLHIKLKSIAVAIGTVVFLLSGCSTNTALLGNMLVPTLQPTETAVPMVTPTGLPIPAPIDIPKVNWDDVEIYKQAMKPRYAQDVEAWKYGNRYLIMAAVTIEDNAIIQGAERVRFTNKSKDTLGEVVFRLYPNGPALGGRMAVTHVEVNDQVVAPAFSDIRSVMTVKLPTPLATGQSVEFKVDFNIVMERGLNTSYGRYGFVNNIISATAWYPTLSVYEPGHGWWDSIPSPQGDPAYSETGLYDVRLTLPAAMAVGMSGSIIDKHDNGNGTITYRGVTGPMRDHAFQASERYLITDVTVDGMVAHVMHYKETADKDFDGTALAAQSTINAFKAYNRIFGEYPYREFVIAQNPTPSGVEFPGLIQIAQKSWTRGNPYLEIVTAHEVGHQWFYALIGNNQVEHPWLDESLTSFTEVVYARYVYGFTKRAKEYANGIQESYTTYIGRGQSDQPLNLPVTSYFDYAYGAIIYRKGPAFYLELERILGTDVVYRALNVYFSRYKYQVVTTQDVKSVFEEVSGQKLDALFEKWVGSTVDPLPMSRLEFQPPELYAPALF